MNYGLLKGIRACQRSCCCASMRSTRTEDSGNSIAIENESPRSVEEGKSLLSVDIWKGTMVGGGLLLMNPRRRTVKENK